MARLRRSEVPTRIYRRRTPEGERQEERVYKSGRREITTGSGRNKTVKVILPLTTASKTVEYKSSYASAEFDEYGNRIEAKQGYSTAYPIFPGLNAKAGTRKTVVSKSQLYDINRQTRIGGMSEDDTEKLISRVEPAEFLGSSGMPGSFVPPVKYKVGSPEWKASIEKAKRLQAIQEGTSSTAFPLYPGLRSRDAGEPKEQTIEPARYVKPFYSPLGVIGSVGYVGVSAADMLGGVNVELNKWLWGDVLGRRDIAQKGEEVYQSSKRYAEQGKGLFLELSEKTMGTDTTYIPKKDVDKSVFEGSPRPSYVYYQKRIPSKKQEEKNRATYIYETGRRPSDVLESERAWKDHSLESWVSRGVNVGGDIITFMGVGGLLSGTMPTAASALRVGGSYGTMGLFGKKSEQLISGTERGKANPYLGMTADVLVTIGGGSSLTYFTGKAASQARLTTKVKIPTKGGEETWQGISLEYGEKSMQLIGKTKKGGLQFGTPKVKVDTGGYRAYMPETATESKILLKNIEYPILEKTKSSSARTVMSITKDSRSAYVSKEFSREMKALTKKDFEKVLEVTKEHKGLLYGSKAQEAQMPKGKLGRLTADVDIQFSYGPEKTSKIAKGLLLDIQKGGTKARISPEHPTLIETYSKGKWHHAVDIHALESGYYGPVEKGFGFTYSKKPLKIEGVKSMALSEQGLRKGTSSISLWPEKVGPAEHRIKDIRDFISSQETLLSSMKKGKLSRLRIGKIRKGELALEEYKGIIDIQYPGLSKTPGKVLLYSPAKTMKISPYTKGYSVSSMAKYFKPTSYYSSKKPSPSKKTAYPSKSKGLSSYSIKSSLPTLSKTTYKPPSRKKKPSTPSYPKLTYNYKTTKKPPSYPPYSPSKKQSPYTLTGPGISQPSSKPPSYPRSPPSYPYYYPPGTPPGKPTKTPPIPPLNIGGLGRGKGSLSEFMFGKKKKKSKVLQLTPYLPDIKLKILIPYTKHKKKKRRKR